MTVKIRFDLNNSKTGYYITETIDNKDLKVYEISELRILIEKYKRDVKLGMFKI